jgi:hypothetical protein
MRVIGTTIAVFIPFIPDCMIADGGAGPMQVESMFGLHGAELEFFKQHGVLSASK